MLSLIYRLVAMLSFFGLNACHSCHDLKMGARGGKQARIYFKKGSHML